MYVDSLNLRRTVLNCPQLTPAIARSLSLSLSLSVVPTMFGYKSVHRIHLAQDMISDALFFEQDNKASRSEITNLSGLNR
jgi:type II secretory ATPase GspE/PulE/Tfp pilus assembly ATPase PilB-like protein